MKTVLREICHSRAGDKDDTSNVALIAYDKANYEAIRKAVTADVVKQHFGSLVRGEVVRYELPQLGALNFVLREALDGGNTRSLRVDGFGKSFSSLMLSLEVDLDLPATASS